MTLPRLRTAATLVIAAGMLASGCSTPDPAAGDPLSGVCQFKPCVCADADAPVWQVPETVPIIWSRTSGSPACPLGYRLQRSEE